MILMIITTGRTIGAVLLQLVRAPPQTTPKEHKVGNTHIKRMDGWIKDTTFGCCYTCILTDLLTLVFDGVSLPPASTIIFSVLVDDS